MTIAVTILLIAAVLTVLSATIFIFAKALRRFSGDGRTVAPTTASRSRACEPPPFGALPTLSDPVGPLGNPAPDADLSSNADSAREIYGE